MSSHPTQQQPGTYTSQQQDALILAARNAEPSQLLAAAEFVARVFQANAIPFAIMGGYALKLRGSGRDTHDVDVAVGCTMQRLIEVLSAQPRVRRPAGPTSGVMRVFVHVGGQLNAGVPELWVAVDMILRGSLGAPDHPENSSEVLTVNTTAGPKSLPVIDILSSMASKLNAFYARQELSDYEDISFLIRAYSTQVHALRAQLNATYRQFFVASFTQRNAQNINAIRRVKFVLGVA